MEDRGERIREWKGVVNTKVFLRSRALRRGKIFLWYGGFSDGARYDDELYIGDFPGGFHISGLQ